MEPTITVSAQQIDFFRRNGFLSIEAITDASEIASLRQVYDSLFERRAGREVGDEFDLAGADQDGEVARLPQILSPSKYAPEFAEGLMRVNALQVARQLLGEEADWGGDHAIFKPALYGAETPWHQDEAYWDSSLSYNSISIWVPLQEATVENGCMWFVPGSQNSPLLPHHSIGHDPRVHGLEVDREPMDAAVDLSSAVACPLPPGGATIHHNRTLHYTGPNTSPVPRRAYIMAFALPPQKLDEPRDFYWNRIKQAPRQERAARAAAGA
ncbi:MAG: phytanoyl-CoA dioxygenase family protein [Armatimonadetes bacterium]|nr:phytanoyl-CoA dioxygenase family protein [Armatimonadota bacterium]